ncbi:unnamed protein product [Pylaiella littoralis]
MVWTSGFFVSTYEADHEKGARHHRRGGDERVPQQHQRSGGMVSGGGRGPHWSAGVVSLSSSSSCGMEEVPSNSSRDSNRYGLSHILGTQS